VAIDVAVLANDVDPDGDTLSIESATATNGASVEVLANNQLRVTPAGGFAGLVDITYRARDSRGAMAAAANLAVNVGPTARVMSVVSPASPTSFPKVMVTSTDPQDSLEFMTLGPCHNYTWAVGSADARAMVGIRCVSSTRMDVITLAPRAAQLAAPQVLLGDVALAPGVLTDGNFAGVIVAQRVTNPDVPSLDADYELVRIDLAQRTVVQRMPLPEVREVNSIRPAGGSTRRVLINARAYGQDDSIFVADLDTGELRWLGPPGTTGVIFPDSFQASPDGRFVVSTFSWSGEVIAYDLQNPGFMTTLWAPPGVGLLPSAASMQFAQQPGATLLVQTSDALAPATTVVWSVPLDAPGTAHELVRYEDASKNTSMLVRGDQLVYAANAGGNSDIRRVRPSTGEALSTLTPSGGVAGTVELQRLMSNTLLFNVFDGSARRGSLIRLANPGTVEPVAPLLALAGPFGSMTLDIGETAVGLTVQENGVSAAYVVDMNLLTAPVKVTAGAPGGEDTQLMLVFGSPDP
jgi:hypothetical protein